MRRFSRFIPAIPVSLALLAGCSTDRAAAPAPPAASPPETVTSTAAPPTVTKNETNSAGTPATPSGRDPFEPSVVVTAPPPPSVDDRPRKSKRFTIDELKLVGIVSTSDAPRAMLVDPRGKGWVVTRGELIGRPEVLRDGQGDHSVSWRVDRIRESDVILVREDATHSIVPSSTRVLALRHDKVIADDAELDD